MNSPRFETDELSGLWKWPVLLNSDWSRWTEEPCAILFGEMRDCNCEAAVTRAMGKLLGSSNCPNLTVFQIGQGSFLLLGTCYTSQQAQLLAQNINQELSHLEVPSSSGTPSSINATLTWGITLAEESDWNLPRALQAAIAPVERAMREKRFGSINLAGKGWQTQERDDFWVCSRRDPLTELKSWSHTAALCCRYKDEPVALLLGDVDRLRPFMDAHSLPVGDILLQMIAHVLRRFESNDIVAFRFGGDEFLIWTRGQSLERAKQLAEQINAQVRVLQIPVPTGNAPFTNVSLTWGVVGASPHQLDLQAMLRKANQLLTQTKHDHPGSVSAQSL